MEKIDDFIKREKELSKMVFDAYMESEDLSDYSSKISEISKKYGLSCTYLRELRDCYVDTYLDSKDRKSIISAYNSKKSRIRKDVHNIISFGDEIFKNNSKVRNNYVYSLNIPLCSLKVKLDNYKKYNGKYSSEVDKFYRQYVKFYNKMVEFTKHQKNESRLKEACAYYDVLVNVGYYSINDFVFNARFSMEEIKKEKNKAARYRKIILSENDGKLWESYVNKMEQNRYRRFLFFKDKIALFYGNLCAGSADIIDFYLQFDMPIDRFNSLISGYVLSHETVCFNQFFYKYIQVLGTYCTEETILKSNESFGDFIFSDDEKRILIGFMRENHIPFQLYRYVFQKYSSGNLSDYIGFKVKKKQF